MASRHGPIAALAGVVSVVVLYVWDDALFAAPIIAATKLWGVLPAFLVLGLFYWLVSWFLAIVVVRVYEGRTSTADGTSRLERWLTSQTEGRRGRWVEGLLRSGKALGFVVSSFLLGGVVTTWLARYLGRRDGLVVLACTSSAIFAVTFVGFYSGVGRVVLGHP